MGKNMMEIYTHMTANGVELEPNDFKKEIPLEGYLIENPAVLSLNLEGDLVSPEIISSQIAVKCGRPSKFGDGRIDLLGYYGESKTLGIIEVKAGKLCNDHLNQLEDYLKQRAEILNKAKHDLKEYGIDNKNIKWVGVLVGTSIDPDLQKKISSGYLVDKEVPVSALVIRRFKGQKDGSIYVVSESFFKNKSRKYDQTNILPLVNKQG